MNLLLDTHVLLWWLARDPALSQAARDAIKGPGNRVFVSPVAVWEAVIKEAVGKLTLPVDFAARLSEQPFESLPVTFAHALEVRQLPLLHKDPFDRLLIAQSRVEGLTLVTVDRDILRYEVSALPV